MTEDDLLHYAAKHYFADWELKRAEEAEKNGGTEAAIEYLRKTAQNSCRGQNGPSMLGWKTRSGKIGIYAPDTGIMDDPDMTIDIAKFCKLVLEMRYQLRLI